jgi:IclR family KDG regulon transcriptional repressor
MSTDPEAARKYQIAVVHKAIAVVELLASSDHPMGPAEIASRLQMSRNAAFRLLTTLHSCGWVEKDAEARNYQLGLKLFQLGSAAFRSRDIRRLAFPIAEELRNRYEETVNLALLDGAQVVYVERLESRRSLRTATAIGTRAPLHCTALGKAILAHLPHEQASALLASEPMVALTDGTITDHAALSAELEAIRQQGYAQDIEENSIGVHCLGAPIFDSYGRVIAALSVSGPAQRMAEYADRGDMAADVVNYTPSR